LHFLLYLHELCVDLNKNCSEYTQGKVDSDNVYTSYIHSNFCLNLHIIDGDMKDI